MKTYIKKSSLIFATVASLFATSCSDFLDINESPTAATVDVVEPNLLLAGAIIDPRATIEGTMNRLGNYMMNSWAGDVNNFSSPLQDEFRLNITQNFYTGVFNGLYRDMGTYQAIINFNGEGYDGHKAISRILKSYYFQYIVDLYGNVPYSEALQFGDILTPAYDDAETIYPALIADINLAIEALNSTQDTVGGEDTIFNGNYSSWIQLANTIKLKMLLRISDLAASNSNAEITTLFNTEVAALDENFLLADAIHNPGYENANGKQNPFFATFQDIEGTNTNTHDFISPAEYYANFVEGRTTEDGITTGITDPRASAIFDQIGGEVVGVRQGEDNTNAPAELSELRFSPSQGLLRGSSQTSFIITGAESFLLQSEAALKGIISGDAQTLFENGITASFKSLGLSDAQANAYILSSANVDKIGWNGSASKIEAIMTQKWIALSGINGIESWIEYTRTGFPNIPLTAISEQSAKPNRLLYPASEYSTNSANVPNQTASDAFNTKIFWDVN
jgi:hypothetical protein